MQIRKYLDKIKGAIDFLFTCECETENNIQQGIEGLSIYQRLKSSTSVFNSFSLCYYDICLLTVSIFT